jgi:hypothetical protein
MNSTDLMIATVAAVALYATGHWIAGSIMVIILICEAAQ